jgi:prepilin-type N-terminal cleavage/methylation domain-containing protein
VVVRAVARKVRSEERGFTLIELIVVVIIIAVLAVLAIPTLTDQMRSRRTQFAAKEVAAMYRTGRMRAMGRGSAVLVRFENNVTAEGRFEMREAVRSGSANADCDRMPVSSCTLTDWLSTSPNNQLIQTFTSFQRSELQDIRASAVGAPPADSGAQTQMDVCFTPMGRTFVRYNQGVVPFTPLTGVPVVRVFRWDPGSGQPYGIIRTVMILPNGNVRLGSAEAPP